MAKSHDDDDDMRNSVEDAVRQTVASHLQGAEVASVHVSVDEDFFGEDENLIVVRVVFHSKPDGRDVLALSGELRKKLVELGENRFPLVRFMSAAEAGEMSAEAR